MINFLRNLHQNHKTDILLEIGKTLKERTEKIFRNR